MPMSIDERFGVEPLRCDDCGAPVPDHTQYCPSVVVGTREQDRRDQQLDEARQRTERAERAAATFHTSVQEAQRDACLRGFAIVRAAFEAWRDGDKVTRSVGDDTDVFLALQATHLGFQALARALEKK